LSALEGKQIAKGEKVAALVPRVEKESEIPRFTVQNLATLGDAISSENPASRCDLFSARYWFRSGGRLC